MKHSVRAILRVIQSQWEVWMCLYVIVIWIESVSLIMVLIIMGYIKRLVRLSCELGN